MEISSVPFFEDCPSSFFSFSHDLDFSTAPFSKRPRTSGVDDDDPSFQELMDKLLSFDNDQIDMKVPLPIPPPVAVNSSGPCLNYGNQVNRDSYSTYPSLIDYSSNSHNLKRGRLDTNDVVATSPDGSPNGGGAAQRRLWVKSRSNAWWEQINSPDFPDEDFKRAFRMSRATFDMICEELESVVTKKDTMLRSAIPVRQRVAVCIWRLATGEALREVSKRFGLGISTCHKLVLEVCSAIRTVLMPKYLQWPDSNRMAEIKREFASFSGIPNVGGSMYTTHIPIIAPKVNVGAYYNKRHTERNQKASYSITVQGVVDPSGAFTDICIGWPGSMTDDRVLDKSALSQRASRGALRDTWIVANSSLPLTDWVLVPYANRNVTWAQHAFNEKVEEVQHIAKESFMRLKARWSCLQKRTEMKLQDLPVVLAACCVLHNVCEMRGEALSPELRFDLFDDEIVPEDNVRSVGASHHRDQIAHNLLHHDFPSAEAIFL